MPPTEPKSTLTALAGMVEALEKLARCHCDTEWVESLPVGVSCRPGCLHEESRAARRAWRERAPLSEVADVLREVGDEIAAHIMINLPRNQRDFVAAGVLRYLDQLLGGRK